MKEPLGISSKDSIEDALDRASKLSSETSFSATMMSEKDQRRLVRLAYEYKKLLEENLDLKSIVGKKCKE
jgi:hypothetical protein